MAELQAGFQGLKWCFLQAINQTMIYPDSQVVVDMLNKKCHYPWRVKTQLVDITKMTDSMQVWDSKVANMYGGRPIGHRHSFWTKWWLQNPACAFRCDNSINASKS